MSIFDPVMCVILVQGTLECTWSKCLSGMAITVHESHDGARTTLAGVLLDQTALHEVLTTLDNLGLPVLSVTVA